EALERDRDELGREAAALVPHVHRDPRSALRDAIEPNRSGTVPERVVDEVPERLLEANPIAAHLDSRGSRRLDLPPCFGHAPFEAGDDRCEQRRDLDPLSAKLQLALVRARDQEEILGQLNESLCFLRRGADRVPELLGGLAVLQSELELGAEQGQRSPELV